MAGLNFTHILDFMIMMPLGNYLMPYFHITPWQFSVLVGAYSISAAISGFIAAFVVDRLTCAQELYEKVAALGWEDSGTQALYRLYTTQ